MCLNTTTCTTADDDDDIKLAAVIEKGSSFTGCVTDALQLKFCGWTDQERVTQQMLKALRGKNLESNE
jgi:hypothetical protein